jgi:hypothetical protein
MKFLFTITILLFLFSCKKNDPQYNIPCSAPTNDKNTSSYLLKGKWTWVSEFYREQLTGQYILKTPASEGYTKQRTFRSDLTGDFFQNDTAIGMYRYDIVVENIITNFATDTTNVLVFKDFITGNRSNYVHYKICNDTLTLNYQIRSSVTGQEKWVKQ